MFSKMIMALLSIAFFFSMSSAQVLYTAPEVIPSAYPYYYGASAYAYPAAYPSYVAWGSDKNPSAAGKPAAPTASLTNNNQ
uniref:Nematode Specific Peptide family, group B n=1 Tax=Caenorhabditis japonica TaxID=281687 RepID=A0A8R1E0S6_CAEJA